VERKLRSILGGTRGVTDEAKLLLERLLALYPADLRPALRADAPRIAEHAGWVAGSSSVLDVGGGYSAFAPLCEATGIDATVVDTLAHELFARDDLRKLVDSLGIKIVRMDPLAHPLPFANASFDAITSFDSIEHWHHSPRKLFIELSRVATPNALLILGAPNAVNLRKRAVVALGRSNWSRFEDWYDEDTFAGHVREPTVADLELIASRMDLDDYTIVGRNWLGFRRAQPWRTVTRVVDVPLRLRPSLCANLYLVGRFRNGR
jgi:SAM-dependent methyltransferase